MICRLVRAEELYSVDRESQKDPKDDETVDE